jgi:hypothetical protein
MEQLDVKQRETRAFIAALNHCCKHIQQVQTITEARDLILLLKDVRVVLTDLFCVAL